MFLFACSGPQYADVVMDETQSSGGVNANADRKVKIKEDRNDCDYEPENSEKGNRSLIWRALLNFHFRVFCQV